MYLSNAYQAICMYHAATMGTPPQSPSVLNGQDAVDCYHSLAHDLDEIEAAMNLDNLADQSSWLIEIIVTALRYLARMGVNPDPAFNAILEAAWKDHIRIAARNPSTIPEELIEAAS